jgi:RNA polymerase sigma-70 factor (ECF subfamily)
VPDDNSFQQLILRVRAGDGAAAAVLLRRYEPAIRRTVHIHLRDPRLRRLLDSMDICQSVFASFFVRAASGQYWLDTPENLLKLLVTIARNKLASQVRKNHVQRRECPPDDSAGGAGNDLVAPGPGPSQQAAAADLLREFRRRLSEEERALADQRAQGREWAEIAAGMGGSPQALRKRLERAVDRVARQLRLEEPDDE